MNHDYRQPLDSLEQVEADLADLPPLRHWHVPVYLHGGWHKYAQRPPKYETAQVADGKNVKGETVYRTRVRDLEQMSGRNYWDGNQRYVVRVEEASRASTLALIREMRRSGWTEDEARTMMYRWPARGTKWLREQDDSDREFDRCWRKAAVPVSDLPDRPRQRKTEKPWVSHPSDQNKVLAHVQANPGLGRNELLRSGCGLEGKHVEGRIKEALKVLIAQGRIAREPGPRRALFHYAVPVPVEASVEAPVSIPWKDVMPQSEEVADCSLMPQSDALMPQSEPPPPGFTVEEWNDFLSWPLFDDCEEAQEKESDSWRLIA